MFINFFTVALRNIFKHKTFSFINIFGLAIGIASCLLILQYVRYERSYDQFEKKGDRIFRLQLDRYNNGKLSTQWAAGAAGVGKFVKDDLPDIESYAILTSSSGQVVTYKDQKTREDKMFFATESFLPMFSYQTLAGDKEHALQEPFTAVLTASAAKKYFGSEDPVGKTFSINKNDNFKVTAVVADPPVNTHLKFNVLLSYATMIKWRGPKQETAWNWDGYLTYILVRPGADPALLEKKIAGVVQTRNGADFKAGKYDMIFHLQPLRDIHLTSHYMHEAETNGDGKAVHFLLIIALFVIVIAWINYINLSTARSIDRAREVGIRKVLGSHRRQLIGQFLFESLFINLLAVILAFAMILISLPLLNSLTGKGVNFSLLHDRDFWLALGLLFLTGSFLSGLYPAFVLSSFRPIAVLKGRLSKTGHGALLRQSLVIMQFAASVILMIGTFAVYKQLNFMQRQDLGVQIDQTLVLRGPGIIDSTYDNKLSAFKDEMLKLPGVSKMTASTEVPGVKVGWNAGGIQLTGAGPGESNQYRVIGIDYDFINTYGLKVLKGRNFSRQFSTDPKTVLFNEAAVKLMGFKKAEDAIGRRIDFWGEQYDIIGVVSNHHQESLKQAYDAHIFRLIPNATRYYSLRLNTSRGNYESIVRSSEKKWANFFPANPFEYFFLDEHYAEQYKADKQFGNTFGIFALLAILVSSMGLLGLASFVTTQRTKEIGIRKIVGAGIPNILRLLTRDFIRPVLISFLVAIPVTWWLLKKWLENFAYKVGIDPWMFILPAFLILLIALLTISTQTIKAASANPVKSLRTE